MVERLSYIMWSVEKRDNCGDWGDYFFLVVMIKYPAKGN